MLNFTLPPYRGVHHGGVSLWPCSSRRHWHADPDPYARLVAWHGLADPKMKARLADLGATALPSSPAEFGKFIADETEKWGKVVKFSGAKAD